MTIAPIKEFNHYKQPFNGNHSMAKNDQLHNVMTLYHSSLSNLCSNDDKISLSWNLLDLAAPGSRQFAQLPETI